MNYYQTHDDAGASYTRFESDGGEIQAMFDEAATCEGPYGMDTFQFYPDPDDA